MANIKDIAKMAGVSVTTVSRVLNQHPYVKEDKRKRVEDIINKLDYRQNSNAIHLVKGKTETIGVIVPYIDHPYFQMLVSGITEEAFKQQYSILLCPTNYSIEAENTYLKMLQAKQIDGLIFCSRASSWERLVSYSRYGPIIACEKSELLPCVYTDHYRAFTAGVEYLVQKGHTRIGYCSGRTNSQSSVMRALAYQQTLSSLDLPVTQSWVFNECFTIEDGKAIMAKLLALEERPTALLVNGDSIAAGMIMQAKKEGLSIPEDLALIGIDNQPISEVLELTTIDQHLKELGLQAFNSVKHRIACQTEIPFSIIERLSV
ncbi:LacI family DNA-binding transcriptional regulator [Bacillus sp. 1P06AnD]|uniref:LacI family DNA-binding transcriptional regulator n=1 Tax=Bacillus sp. 1P06AnD TaxID=3132208 RepID=UPI0039A19E0B